MKKKYSLIIIGIILIGILGMCILIFSNRTSMIASTEAEILMQNYFIHTNQWEDNYVLQPSNPIKGKVGSDEVYRFELRYKDSVSDVKGRLIGNYLITVDGNTILWYDSANDEYVIQQSLDKQLQFAENRHTEDVNDIKEKSETESIQDEIAKVEVKSCEYENADWSSMGQQEMNQLTAQWYQLWDDELNSLWSRLSDELDAETKAKVLDEQRAWIKRKEENVKGAGAAAFGGSLQPQLENSVAEEMTRARAYILAGYLADVRNESFTIPSEIQESIDMADTSLNDVFKKFEGQWIFDKERGACVGIERTETCAYGVEGSNWTVWVTGGDIISDIDVYGYTGNSIIFKIAHDGYDAFYELSFNQTNSINFAYGTSLYAMNDVIVCD